MEKLENRYTDERYTELAELGFSPESVQKFIGKGLYIPTEVVKIKGMVESFKNLGFENPIELFEKNPSILSEKEDRIYDKITGLKELGFFHPIDLIQKSPTILNISQELIIEKINSLKHEGLMNPIETIEKFPAILTYNKEGITQKIKYMEYAFSTLTDSSHEKAREQIIKYVEYTPSLLGTKFDKLAVLVRVLTMLKKPDELPTEHEINRLARANLEDVLLTLDEMRNDPEISFAKFIAELKKIKKEEFEKSLKQEVILGTLNGLESDDDTIHEDLLKVLKRYKRGYIEA